MSDAVTTEETAGVTATTGATGATKATEATGASVTIGTTEAARRYPLDSHSPTTLTKSALRC